MAKGETPWQSLSQYIGVYLEEEGLYDRFDLTFEVVHGGLGHLPHLDASVQMTSCSETDVVLWDIAPDGTIALVLEEAGADRLVDQTLVVWSVERGLSKRKLDGRGLYVFFPEGASEPIVVNWNHDVVWGDYRVHLPDASDRASEQFAWEEGDDRFLAHTSYPGEGTEKNSYVLFRHDRREPSRGTVSVLDRNTDWIGLVGGSLARIVTEDDHQALCWRDQVVSLPVRERIVAESIGVVDGRLQFAIAVDAEGNLCRACSYRDGLACSPSVFSYKDAIFDRGEILVFPLVGSDRRCERFDGERFVTSGLSVGLTRVFGPEARVFVLGSTVDAPDHSSSQRFISYRDCVIRPDGDRWVPDGSGDLAVARFHHGVGFERRNRTWHWGVPNSDERVDFPLYGQAFSRLTAVEDARGKAVMGWVFAHGTLHILRYPLPT